MEGADHNMDGSTIDNRDITALDGLEATVISVQQNASVLRPQSPRRTISQPLNDTAGNTKNGSMNVVPESMTQNLRSLAQTINKNITPTATRDLTNSRFTRTPSRYPNSARKGDITTPHAKAARMKRAQPGKNGERRRSGRFAPDDNSTFDVLRQLSRITADKSKPFIPTPTRTIPSTPRRSGVGVANIQLRRDPGAEDDEALDVRPPRLSVGSAKIIGTSFDDDSTSDEDRPVPPRMSVPLESPNGSPEVARRAVSEQPFRFFSRHSLGGRYSDRFETDVVHDDSMMIQNDLGYDDDSFDADEAHLQGLSLGENTQALRVAFQDEDTDTQNSMIGPLALTNDEQTDVFLPEPQRSPSPPLNEDITSGPPDLLMQHDDSDDVLSDGDEQQMGGSGLRSARRQETPDVNPVSTRIKQRRKKKELPRSQYNIEYPAFPARIIKKLASTLSKSKISKDVLNEIVKASDFFFANVGEDLGALAHHAGRKTIEDSDVLQLMKRQRKISTKSTIFSLAHQHLPRELLQDIRIQIQNKSSHRPRKSRTKKASEQDDEVVDESIVVT